MSRIPLIHSPMYDLHLPNAHKVSGHKFSAIYSAITEGPVSSKFDHQPHSPATAQDLAISHDPDYVARFQNNLLTRSEMNMINLPWSADLLERSFLMPNGTFECAKRALDTRIACHTAGGAHHAYHGFGYGFCVFNDLAFTALQLKHQGIFERILILDCDVHQGDGTIDICQGHPDIFTCSMHGQRYVGPLKRAGSFDVELSDGTEDREYIDVLFKTLQTIANNFVPDIVLYDAGVDIYFADTLGKLNISLDGIEHRDRMVLDFFRAKNIPVATVIGGGYSKDQSELLTRHLSVFHAAAEIY
jgi:acetoin utilization deacetylase AcuC-like enzyme